MRPLAAATRTGSPASARQRREGARSIVAGAAPWALLTMACDAAWAQGAAVDTWHARVGTSPTAAGAARPAVDGRDLLFGGAQRMSGASGLLGGVSGATAFAVVQATSTSGQIYAYGTGPYYAGKRSTMGKTAALTVAVGNGESDVDDRTTSYHTIGSGMRTLAAWHDRSAASGSETQCYDDGNIAPLSSAFDNDTTGNFASGEALTIGAYSTGSSYVTGRYRAIGLVAAALPAGEVRRLSLLLESACG